MVKYLIHHEGKLLASKLQGGEQVDWIWVRHCQQQFPIAPIQEDQFVTQLARLKVDWHTQRIRQQSSTY